MSSLTNQQCEHGYYFNATGNAGCTKCPANANCTSAEGKTPASVTCLSGFKTTGGEGASLVCQPCYAGENCVWSAEYMNQTSPECARGYYLAEKCEPCPQGGWCPGGREPL